MDKQTYKKASVLEPYFTGGAARVTRDGKLLACVCGEEVKVVDIATGAVLRTIEGVRPGKGCFWRLSALACWPALVSKDEQPQPTNATLAACPV
eukprot:1154560-Pelagomonas_calceolata.AAC.22